MTNAWLTPAPHAPWVADGYRRVKSEIQTRIAGEHREADRDTTLVHPMRVDEALGRQALVAAGSHLDDNPDTEDVILLFDRVDRDEYQRKTTFCERKEDGRQVLIAQVEAGGESFYQKIDPATTEVLEESTEKCEEFELHRADILADWHYMEKTIREHDPYVTDEGRLLNPTDIFYGIARIFAGSVVDDQPQTPDVILHNAGDLWSSRQKATMIRHLEDGREVITRQVTTREGDRLSSVTVDRETGKTLRQWTAPGRQGEGPTVELDS